MVQFHFHPLRCHAVNSVKLHNFSIDSVTLWGIHLAVHGLSTPHEVLSPCSQELATKPYHESDECHPHPLTLFKINLNDILGLPRCLFPTGFLIKILYTFLISTMSAAYHIHLFLLCLITLIYLYLINSSNYEAAHYTFFFSNLLFLPPPFLLDLNMFFITLKHPESMFFTS